MTDTQKVYGEIKKFLVTNADSIQKLATQQHKEFVGGERFRTEVIKRYQDNHKTIVKELAAHLEKDETKKGLEVFKKLALTIANDSVQDDLYIEEALDGIIFLKQALWEKIENEGLLKNLSLIDFYYINRTVGIYIDTVSSKIAFAYHEKYIKKINDEIKQRNKSEASLESARVYAENIVNTVREPLLVLDSDLHVISANKSFYQIYRVTMHETLGKRIYTLGNGQWDIPTLKELLEKIIPDKKSFENFEVKHTFPTIGHKIMLLNARQLAQQQLILLAIEDVTERRTTEQARDRYLKELGRSNQELEQFAYIASHDLQEPLRMVVSYLQLLDKRYNSLFDEKAKRWINFAVDGGKRMQTLLSDLLSYSRIATKAKPLERTDLNIVLHNVLDDLQTIIKKEHVVVKTTKLPIVHADPVQMGQVFQNLIANAIKFKNKKKPSITIASEQSNKKWVISVKDNGIGISKEYFEKIFIIFQRLHTRDEYPGTGIGLAVCKKIIERHNGELWLESSLGRGTTFFFSIPIRGGDKT